MKLAANARKLLYWSLLTAFIGIWSTACTQESAVTTPKTQTGHESGNGGSAKDAALPENSGAQQMPQAAAEREIKIENFVFEPAELTVAPGTRVTWVNKDEAPHTATSIDDKFNSGGLDTDDRYTFVFNEKGDFPYFCALHPQMKALVKVR
jgi:plastocyanin